MQCHDAILDRDAHVLVIEKSIRPHGCLNPLLDLRIGYGLLDFLARDHDGIEGRGWCADPIRLSPTNLDIQILNRSIACEPVFLNRDVP